MRLLVLEDDTTLGPWIEQGLNEAGHVVDLFADGKDALIAATTQPYDALILDRMVPGLDGLSVLKALRQAKVTAPAIFLTALGEIENRVEGLQAGGDDYLVKPFAFSELSARIEAVTRRRSSSEKESALLEAGDITIDLHKRICTRQGQAVDLNPKEFLLLEVFVRSKGRVQTRTMLLERVWSMNFDPTSSVVETHISRLRAKIEKPFGDTVIRTIRGSGYVFESA
ncbi:DNA-binding response regulator, OmpR family, contains REC and winged-helix (wHTH) domain [Aliiroseovarius halocynthiae]|uniref:Response regulator transcription factor n=1 Tax=Aliiroseovarius halocynthiae TaxID=985055 RepID=A0A545SQB5_9RHOB|nr:response regulator transcription factor [Aliiroseovarius halocynthiae]TQV67159.1 response regulator transcription factor [Aliiroseovarius halocynthiae]SMR82111.1 DNA-binding response regulator, OmpR family, contains REC and winged-helix (wHTH) domain [Aliiroseovarius halocynthiae]